MATKRYRKSNKSKELTYEDIKGLDFNSLTPEELEQYGFGSWLKKKAGAIGTVVGAGVGMLLGPAGSIAGASLGASLGGSVGGAVSQSEMAKEQVQAQNAQTAQMEQQQKLNIANQELQQKMSDNPLYSGVMRNGGRLRKMKTGGDIKYFLTTSAGKKEISAEKLDSVKKYLDIQNKINSYYTNKYKTNIDKFTKLGINTPQAYAEYIAKNPKEVLPAEDYPSIYKNAGLTEEEINIYDPGRNEYFTPEEVQGTLEGVKGRVTDTAFGGRNFFAGLKLGLEEIPSMIETPTSPYSYEPLRGYPNIQIGYTIDKTGGVRTPSVFRNAAGKEIPIDPKKGLIPEEYPELTKDMQYAQPKKPLSQMRFKFGGTLNYGGQLHEGPNGGVPVDEMGNPNQVNPVALVEKGEVSYNTPDGGTYIYSDTLKYDKNKTFAKKAKDVQRRYKFRMKDGVINDPFAKKSYDNEMLGLMDNQEELRDFQNMQSLQKKKYGGNLPEYQFGGPYNEFNPTIVAETQGTGMRLPEGNPPMFTTAGTDYSSNFDGMIGSNKFSTPTSPKLYQGMNWAETGLAAAGPILGGITGLILNSRRKAPTNLRLSRMTPQQINLERRRAAARESAGVATSNLTRSLRNAAPTAGSYMANVTGAVTDINRNLSNELGESYTQEELQNAQLRQQAEAANLDIDMQEQMYNSQLQNQFNASKEAARNAYISQIAGGVTGALNQKFQSSRDADFLNMLNPDYAMAVTGKGLRRKKMILPRTQIGG